MFSDEFNFMITYPCAACGKRIQQTEDQRSVLDDMHRRLCQRCIAAGFKHADDNEFTNQTG